MVGSEDLLICATCGTQFDEPATKPLKACRICDDPRQYVAQGGYTWTSLAEMRIKHYNKWKPVEGGERMWSIWTEPKFAIGQRCILLGTPHGNVLWDCITYLDDATVEFIKSRGGLKAIVISHPHYYTTHVDWAQTFGCPVYLAADDKEWLNRKCTGKQRTLFNTTIQDILPGVVAAKTGGHFPGSLVLLWHKKLMIADTFVTTPSAYYHKDRLPGTTSYAFMWSIPNMIPLSPTEIHRMWQVVKLLEFESTHAAFVGTEVRDKNVKNRVLESMKIQVRHMGHDDHDILKETL